MPPDTAAKMAAATGAGSEVLAWLHAVAHLIGPDLADHFQYAKYPLLRHDPLTNINRRILQPHQCQKPIPVSHGDLQPFVLGTRSRGSF